MNARLYDPKLGRLLSVDNYVSDPASPMAYNRYTYANNNPISYVDPTGNFITWNIGSNGFSIGFNFTPVGAPVGAGINIGWGNGFSAGVYVEAGPRVGGSGFGSGLTVSQSFTYNFKQGNWSTSTTTSAYASFMGFNAGANASATYDFESTRWSSDWGVSAGVGFGDPQMGIGLAVTYGSGGLGVSVGGYYDKHAWDSNPTYELEKWNDNGEIQQNNNCYTYALDDPKNPANEFRGRNPGETSGVQIDQPLSLKEVESAAIKDGLKKPNFLNKLGFGKKGYYEVYLVVGADGLDYHWYRQDKGGRWSHKPGITPAYNTDASYRAIINPSTANHNYPGYQYNGGGVKLWKKR